MVINGSFEDGPGTNQFPANQWRNSYSTLVHLFDNNLDSLENAVPQNLKGYQLPQHGKAYIGFSIAYFAAMSKLGPFVKNSKGLIQTKLLRSLEAGKMYKIQMYVSLADSCFTAVDQMGVYMTRGSNPYKFPKSPNVTMSNGFPLQDRKNWQLLTSYYLSKGGEQFMAIGFNDYDGYNTKVIDWKLYRFMEDQLLLPDKTNYHSPFIQDIFYYVDNVSMTEIDDHGLSLNRYFIIEGVQFPTTVYELSSSDKEKLLSLINILTENESFKLKLVGHTDSDGDENDNHDLSMKRAESVKTFLVEKGIASRRIKVIAKGEKEPISGEKSKLDKQINRRVEAYILVPK